MKIAIFGSWRPKSEKWNIRNDRENFKRACISLGKEIAKYGHRVIVGGDSENTADRWIVEGIIEKVKAMKLTTPLIEVVERVDKHVFRGDFANTYPTLFTYYKKRHSWWEGVYLGSVREADIILTIGGGKGTYLSGLTSVVAKKKLVSIGSFGGASEKLLDLIELEETNREIKDKIRILHGDWTDFTLKTVIGLMRISSYPMILIIHGRSDDWEDLEESMHNSLGFSELIVMEQVFGEGKTLPEKFEYLALQVDACIAVATPDDIGRLSSDKDMRPQARQNVWLETG